MPLSFFVVAVGYATAIALVAATFRWPPCIFPFFSLPRSPIKTKPGLSDHMSSENPGYTHAFNFSIYGSTITFPHHSQIIVQLTNIWICCRLRKRNPEARHANRRLRQSEAFLRG